jgi:glycosidase
MPTRSPVRSRRLLVFALGLTAAPLIAGDAPAAPAAGWRHDWARGAVFYEVFVRSFADSNGDGVGDLQGLISRLDYLNDGDPATTSDLGVDALWLMPIFESPSYHGYDVVDYERIDAEYGTLADFERLVAEAHRRGLKIIVDFVMNHTGIDHPWFVESAKGGRSPKRNWYVWRLSDPGWKQPWGNGPTWHPRGGAYYYGIFWSGMPDLNFDEPAVRAEMKRLARLWLDRGADGFRLDATRHLDADGPGELQNDRPETHAFLRELAASVRATHPEALLVGENWTDTRSIAPYFGSTAAVSGGDELPMNFNFPLAAAVIDAVRRGDGEPVRGVLAEMAAVYPKGILDAPFLTNHDQTRLANLLDRDPKRLALAAAVLLTLPGAPFLYYGEEVGLGNGTVAGDPAKRTPMPWDATGKGFSAGSPWLDFAPGLATANVAAQTGDPASLLSGYRSWIQLRKATPALARGELAALDAPGQPPALLAWLRDAAGAGRVLVVHNLGAAPAAGGPWKLAGAPRRLAGEGTATAGATGIRVELPPRSSAVFALE